MKLSLAWIFDHLDVKLADINIHKLFERFNTTIAEIDYQTHVICDLNNYAIGQVEVLETDAPNQVATLYVAEWDKKIVLPALKNKAKQLTQIPGEFYILKRENKNNKEVYSYATLQDFGSEKEGLLPAVYCSEEDLKGGWKDKCDKEDYIITIDNKALTHRPDLWGHRGIAREMAALLDVKLVSEEKILSQIPVKNYDKKTIASPENPIVLENDAPEMCTRLAGLYVREVANKQSLPHIARRLASIDARPLNALIDTTNYVMFDLGQPVHAFDATSFVSHDTVQDNLQSGESSKTGILKAQAAPDGQEFELLDGDVITLTNQDCVITNGDKILSLAGIMGGEVGGVSPSTCSLLIESAHFMPAIIRKSSIRHKKRTEASARFEKGLDPNQNTRALKRIIKLLDLWDICYKAAPEILSLGKEALEKVIRVEYSAIVRLLGVEIPLEDCVGLLTKLGFSIKLEESDSQKILVVTVPTYRARDCNYPEDIIEEIARFVGYNNLPYKIPSRVMTPVDNKSVMRVREIKRHCAFALGMHEVAQYALYDEEFLRTLKWEPKEALELANPVSENWRRLVTTRVPHLFKALVSNIPLKKPVRFFEWSKIWQHSPEIIESGIAITQNFYESNSLAALWFDPSSKLDFYEAKAEMSTLFDLLGISVKWEKPQESSCLAPWFHPYQTARLVVDTKNVQKTIGYAGMVNPFFLRNVISEGNAWVVELSGDYLLEYVQPTHELEPLSKYPHSDVDISMWVPATVTVQDLEATISAVDARISNPNLIDYFQKQDQDTASESERAITVRYTVGDEHKTLTRSEIDEIALKVKEAIEKLGITVR